MKKFLLLASIVILLSCESNEDQITNDVNSVSTPDGTGTFLAQISSSANSTISFWEIEPGLLMISRSGDSKEDFKSLGVEQINGERSVVDIYKDIAKGKVKQEYLTALQQAQDRKERAAANSIFDRLSPEALEEANQKITNEFSRTAIIPRTNCQPDLFNDAYGDRWFVSTYGPASRITQTGQNDYEEISGIIKNKNIRVVGMAADFAATAIFKVFRMNSSLTQWVTVHNITLPARHISEIIFLSESTKWYRFEIIGQAPCPRVHWLYQKL